MFLSFPGNFPLNGVKWRRDLTKMQLVSRVAESALLITTKNTCRNLELMGVGWAALFLFEEGWCRNGKVTETKMHLRF